MKSGKNRIYNVKKPYGYFIFVIVNTVKVFSAVQINYKVTDKVNNAFIGNIGIILGLQPCFGTGQLCDFTYCKRIKLFGKRFYKPADFINEFFFMLIAVAISASVGISVPAAFIISFTIPIS